MKFTSKVAVFIAAGAIYACAADLAILRNGNSIRHEKREVVGAVTRLYLSDASSGYIEIPSDQIERFEKDATPAATSTSSGKLPPTSLNPQAVSSLTREGLNQVVNGAGERHQIDPDFINSVIRAESGFQPHAVSKKGAQGLMQLMPGTASQLGVRNAFDPKANVDGGTSYLRELLEKYNYDVPKALAAYNAGPKRVDQYHGVPPYYETQAYIARIIKDFNRRKIAENPALARRGKPSTSSPNATKHSSQRGTGGSPTHATARGARPGPQLPPKAALADSVPQGSQTASR